MGDTVHLVYRRTQSPPSAVPAGPWKLAGDAEPFVELSATEI